MPPKKKKKQEVKLTPAQQCVADLKAKMNSLVTIHRAAYLGQEEELKKICSEVKDVAELSVLDKNGRTALSLASEYGHTGAVELLLDAKANIASESFGGRRALHFAAKAGSLGVTKVLLERKADASAADSTGQTSLMLSCKAGHLKVTETLCEVKGNNIDAQNKAGCTALMGATLTCQLAIIDVLVAKMCDANITDGIGNTALHVAAHCGYDRAIGKLLSAKGDVNVANSHGKTPLDLAINEASKKLLG